MERLTDLFSLIPSSELIERKENTVQLFEFHSSIELTGIAQEANNDNNDSSLCEYPFI